MNGISDECIAALERRVEEARAAYAAAIDDLNAARILRSGVVVGDVVRATGRRRKGNIYRVVTIEPQSWNTCWIVGNPKRKDGTFGTAQHRIFDWEKA